MNDDTTHSIRESYDRLAEEQAAKNERQPVGIFYGDSFFCKPVSQIAVETRAHKSVKNGVEVEAKVGNRNTLFGDRS